MNRSFLLGVALAAQLAIVHSASAANGPIFATYTGPQQGVTERDASLTQQAYFGTGVDASGIAANGAARNLYITAGNLIVQYGYDGSLLQSFAFPDPNINYTAAAFGNNTLYATYTGSQQGVTERDASLNQIAYFSTGVNATGIAVGPLNNLYISAGNHLYDYTTGGALLTNFAFPDANILYTGIAYGDGLVFASYDGSQQGFTERDLALNQIAYFNTGFQINGIAVGNHNDVLLASGNSIYDYAIDGQLLQSFSFGDQRINYSAIAFSSGVPELSAWALMGLGFAGLGGTLRRRRQGRMALVRG